MEPVVGHLLLEFLILCDQVATDEIPGEQSRKMDK
jgi:hypothetical protein